MTRTNFRAQLWTRGLIVLTALLLGGYVFGVLWHAQGVPEIGFQFSFRPIIEHVDSIYLDPAFGGRDELRGATVIQVGDRNVETWPQLVRALEGLEQVPYVDRDSLSEVHGNYARVDNVEWVRVGIRPANGSSNLAVWCRVGHAPPVAILPLLLWFALEMAIFLVAASVWWNRPEDSASRLFFLMTVTVVAALLGGYHWARIVTQPLLLIVYMVSAVMLPAVSLHFYQIFPRPKPWLLTHPHRSWALTFGPSLTFLGLMLGGYGWVRWLSRGGAPDRHRYFVRWVG